MQAWNPCQLICEVSSLAHYDLFVEVCFHLYVAPKYIIWQECCRCVSLLVQVWNNKDDLIGRSRILAAQDNAILVCKCQVAAREILLFPINGTLCHVRGMVCLQSHNTAR